MTGMTGTRSKRHCLSANTVSVGDHPTAAMPRIFLAIDLPETARSALQRLRPTAATGVRPVNVDQLHLTLHFLGDVPASRLPQLTSNLTQIEFSAFPISIAGVGRFPPQGRASVLWAGVRPSPPLHQLHSTLQRSLVSAGYAVEERAYTPHVTLARLTPQAPHPLPAAFLAAHADVRLPEITVSQFVAYESQRGRGGSRHIPRLTVQAQPQRPTAR